MAKASTATWDVFHIKSNASKFVGTVEARDEADAIKKAVAQFRVELALNHRLIARKTRL